MYNWYALYVRSRHESITNRELQKKGMETFFPSVKRMRQWKDRRKLIEFPLFPGYLFVYIKAEPQDFLNIIKTRGAVMLLSAERGNPTPVPTEEISSLKLLMESGKDLDVFPHLKEGMRVRVKRGPLRGAEGMLIRKMDNFLIVVNVDILGRSVGVKVYSDDVELCN